MVLGDENTGRRNGRSHASYFGGPSASTPLDRFLLRIVDGCLAGVIFVVPLLMGGRHAIGQLALTVLAVAAAWAWSAHRWFASHQPGHSAGATPLPLRDYVAPVLILTLGVALLLVQTAPLPAWLFARLSPNAASLLPLWHEGDVGLGAWSCLSMTPAETAASLVVFLDYGLLFLVASQRIRCVEHVERLLRWCALSTVVVAMLGIAQLVAGDGRFFWFYEHPLATASDVAKGSFTNRNHFAQFLALGIGPLIWWLQDALRHRRRGEMTVYWLGLALGVVLFAGLLSLSRGGMAAMLLAAVVATALCWRGGASGGRLLAALGAAVVLIGVSLWIFGLDRVSDRIEDFSAGSIDRLDQSAGRRTIWAATLKAIPNFLPLGSGAGSFCDVHPMYTNVLADDDRDATHAENGPLQVTLENGAAGALLLVAGIALCGWWCAGGIGRHVPGRLKVCAGACTASLVASVAHSLVDFVWYVPACTALVVLFAAYAMRIRRMARCEADAIATVAVPATAKQPRFSVAVSVAAFLLLAGVGIWMIGNRIGPAMAQPDFDRFMVEYRAAKTKTPDGALADPVDEETLLNWVSCLESVICWEPTHCAAHLRLAEIHRRLFEKLQVTSVNQMPLQHIADAVRQQQFPSREALVAWLTVAIGPHWKHLESALDHARQALDLGPLRGRAYLVLAELSFLRGDQGSLAEACLDQALRVRPLDGAVLWAASQKASLAGNPSQAMKYAKLAFQSGPRGRRQVIAGLVAGTPTEGLPGLIDSMMAEFRPDYDALKFLYGVCAPRGTVEQLTPLIRRCAEQAEVESRKPHLVAPARAWMEAHAFYARIGEHEAALRCVRKAVDCEMGNYEFRRQLGLYLLHQHLYREAESHLRWCQDRMPSDRAIAGAVRDALRGRLDAEARSASQKAQLE